MIKSLPLDTLLKQAYKGRANVLLLYYWDWRINRFMRDFCEQVVYNNTINLNGIDPSSNIIELDLSLIDRDKDKLDFLLKLLKRYNFKYLIF